MTVKRHLIVAMKPDAAATVKKGFMLLISGLCIRMQTSIFWMTHSVLWMQRWGGTSLNSE